MEENNATSQDLLDTSPAAEDNVNAHDQGISTGELRELSVIDRNSKGLSSASLDNALDGVLASNSKRYGFAVVLRLASIWARELTTRNSTLDNQLIDAQKKHETLADENTALKIETAALKAEAGEREKHWPLVTFALVSGPFLVSIGLDQLKSGNWSVGVTLLIIGIVFIAAAFIVNRKGDRS
jgi:hypothetical protein